MSDPVAPARAWAIGVALVVAAVLPRVGPALAGYQASNDAAEHLLIARSLARGEGFTLPIRVRDVDGGPAVHEAYGERAPLFPWLLSVVVRTGVSAKGWPDPRLQLLNVLLAALCAPLAASVCGELARRRGLGAWSAGWAAIGAGLLVAWAPSLVRASVHLWAEPLGLLLVLVAVRLELRLDERRGWRAAAALGLVGGLVRFARPEAWVLVPLLLAGAVWRARGDRRRRGELVAIASALAVVNVLGIALTGVIAPQLFLFTVRDFHDVMGHDVAPAPLDLAFVAAAVGRNLAAQLEFLLLPRNGWFVLPLVAHHLVSRVGPRRSEELWLVTWAAGFVVATAGVWSTNDPSRFTIAPLALLAPVALVQAITICVRAGPSRRRVAFAVTLGSLVLVIGHAAGRELRGRGPRPAPGVVASVDGAAVVADPWSYALITGRPALLSSGPRRASGPPRSSGRLRDRGDEAPGCSR